MDRAEVIRLLTELRQAGELGSPRWNQLMESIQRYGPIHDPEFLVCHDCGIEFERPEVFGRGSCHPPTRCFDCQAPTPALTFGGGAAAYPADVVTSHDARRDA